MDFSHDDNGGVDMVFQVGGQVEKAHADIIVGADGIRSIVREMLIDEERTPLHYTGFIVILGICSLDEIQGAQSTLLD